MINTGREESHGMLLYPVVEASCFVAHQLKYKYGMNPLLVTWSPLQYTNIGIKNFDNLNNAGFSNIK